MNKKAGGKQLGSSNLPVPTLSQGNLSNASRGANTGLKMTHSAEDIPKQIGTGLSIASSRGQSSAVVRRAISPGEVRRKSMISPIRPLSQSSIPFQQLGVRYITEDLIQKITKETNLDLILSLNLTLSKEGGKKIKYIENLDRLRKLQTLNISSNSIEKMERLDKLLRLQELNLSNNKITKIEGIENLTALQTLNLNDNLIEHIPLWLSKKLKALRNFKIARNKINSLSEVAKLKSLPDLIQLDLTGNHLVTLPHYRLYIIFHLRTVEILDNQTINDKERQLSLERFSNDEVEQLEKKLEEEELKYRQLQDSHSKSLHEKSIQETSQHQLEFKERNLQEQLKQLKQELAAKDELLKRKTSDLNKASQKHYQLEQELAFYKIDSKFDSLKDAPNFHLESGDDSSDLQESPYIGRARFKVNQISQETSISVSPQKAQFISVQSSPSVSHLFSPSKKDQIKTDIDKELDNKRTELYKTEEKLKVMQSDLLNTEKMLLNATTELKKIATDRFTPEPFRDDSKYKLRQRLTRKMQRVNELRGSASQMETEIDRTQATVMKNKNELQRLKSQLVAIDTNSAHYDLKKKEMLDKESQVNETDNKLHKIKQQLQETLSVISKETSDIKKLEEQLPKDDIEKNEELHHDLDEVVSGLTMYLENVKSQSHNYKQEVQILVQEKSGLEEKIKHMEADLQKLEVENNNAKFMQMRLAELENSLRKTEETNISLQLNSSKQQELQDRLHRAESEAKQLRLTLSESERKIEIERKGMQKQLQSEKERVDKMTQKIQDVNRQELETKKLLSQLESAKALNAGLRDQIEEFKQKQHIEDGGFKPSDLKKKLNKFTHEFKNNKSPIQIESKNDILGMAFQEVQKHAQEQMNSSIKEVEKLKKYKEQADAEISSLKEKVKKTEESIKAIQNLNESQLEEENKKLQDELNKLKKALEEAKQRNTQGALPVRIVYRPDSESGVDRASSLNSDEKQLFDELQKELLDLKRNMKFHENDLSKKLLDAENEAAHWKDEMKQKEKEFESEIEDYRQATELMREKQEARIQVIAQDLDQAQFVADALQSMLEAREKALSEEFSNAGKTNQMISAQEEELVKLYDILEKQRDEIENLNQMLDHLAQQGPDGVGVGFDDELWRIRQEVNSLKETLAMQSAYVQAMPDISNTGMQATSHSNGISAGTNARNQPNIHIPWNPPDQMRSKFSGSQAASVTSTHQSSVKPFSGATTYSSRSNGTSKPLPTLLGGASVSSAPLPESSARDGGERKYVIEHLGTERKESKNPLGTKSALNRQTTQSAINQSSVPKSVEWGQHFSPASSLKHFQPIHQRDKTQGNTDITDFQPVQNYEHQNTTHNYSTSPMAGQTFLGNSTEANPAQHLASNGEHPPQKQFSTSYPVQGSFETSRGVYINHTRPQTILASQAGVSHHNLWPAGKTSHGTWPSVLPSHSIEPVGEYVQNTALPGAVSFSRMPPSVVPMNSAAPRQVSNGTNPPYSNYVMQGSSGYPFDQYTYIQPEPVHMSHHGSRRTYISSAAGHSGQHPSRTYYPAQQPVPVPAPGGAPPPPPPGGDSHVVNDGYRSAPLVPLATGTPIQGASSPVHYFDDSMLPLSPIRAGHMEYIPKGILKQGVTDQTNGDDGYLFCNVPEHHDLEDYIGELQESIKKLQLRLDKTMDQQEDLKIHEDRKTVKRLLNELEDRREELEGLDLAIERQKKSLSDMIQEEKVLKKQRKDAHSELNFLRNKNDKKLFVRRRHLEDEIFDEEIERSRIKYLFDELKCVEKTLAKRHAQLKDTERNLKECNAELKDAKEQTRDTFKRFDDANSNLHQALKEQQEIEKRSNDVAIELVKATEQLVVLKTDMKELDRKKVRQERLLREINNIISKKDEEFKDMDGKVKIMSEKLQRLQADLVINAEREKDMVQSLHDSEDILAKRRSDIQKLKDQQLRISSATTQKVEQSKQELEKLDQQIGRKKTELQLLQETNERKQLEFTNVLQEAENDITTKHRQMKECRDDLDNMNHQKVDLNNHIKTKKLELHQIKEEIQQEEEVLQRLINNVTKNKTELKHTLEMQKIEQTELENIKVQQAQKLSELERTQRALQDEKSELEQVNSEIARKSADLERLRQAVDRDRLEVDQLTNEKQTLDDRINVLTRDRDLLSDNCKNLDEKLNTMKRNQRAMEEKITNINGRTEMIEAELRLREREMEDAEALKEDMQKEFQSLKTAVNEKKYELKSLEDNIKHVEDQLKLLDKDVRNTFQHRDEVKLELEHLNEQIHISSTTLEEHVRQEKTKYKELQDLLRTLADREKEHQETCLILNKLKNEVENEEFRLKRLVNNANSDLELVKNELTAKIGELEVLKTEFNELQKSNDELQFDKQKCLELNKTCLNLEKDLKDKIEETGELTKALSNTYETIEQLQEENSKIKEKLAKERIDFENTLKDLQGNLEQTKQEVKHVENRTSTQVSKLQSLAEKHFNRANILETELSQAKKEILLTKQQLFNQETLKKHLEDIYSALNWNQENLDETLTLLDHKSQNCQEKTNRQEHKNKDRKLISHEATNDYSDRIFDNKENVSVTEVIIVPSVTQPVITSVADNHWTKDPLRKKLTEEQEYLRFQLKQQMLRHSETMESARIKSEETVECLRKKLNTLQQVLFDTNPSRRSRSPGCKAEFSDIKNRSRSPSEKISFANRRARSSENIF